MTVALVSRWRDYRGVWREGTSGSIQWRRDARNPGKREEREAGWQGGSAQPLTSAGSGAVTEGEHESMTTALKDVKDKFRRSSLQRVEANYSSSEPRPLGSYAVLLATYMSSVIGMVAVGRARATRLPERLTPSDLALLTVGTYRASRLVAKDTVTSVARAPFTEFKESGGPSEVNEQARGSGMRHAAGELISCPFCVSMWVATAGAFGMVAFPKATRLICSVLAVVAGSDALQYGHSALQKAD